MFPYPNPRKFWHESKQIYINIHQITKLTQLNCNKEKAAQLNLAHDKLHNTIQIQIQTDPINKIGSSRESNESELRPIHNPTSSIHRNSTNQCKLFRAINRTIKTEVMASEKLTWSLSLNLSWRDSERDTRPTVIRVSGEKWKKWNQQKNNQGGEKWKMLLLFVVCIYIFLFCVSDRISIGSGSGSRTQNPTILIFYPSFFYHGITILFIKNKTKKIKYWLHYECACSSFLECILSLFKKWELFN